MNESKQQRHLNKQQSNDSRPGRAQGRDGESDSEADWGMDTPKSGMGKEIKVGVGILTLLVGLAGYILWTKSTDTLAIPPGDDLVQEKVNPDLKHGHGHDNHEHNHGEHDDLHNHGDHNGHKHDHEFAHVDHQEPATHTPENSHEQGHFHGSRHEPHADDGLFADTQKHNHNHDDHGTENSLEGLEELPNNPDEYTPPSHRQDRFASLSRDHAGHDHGGRVSPKQRDSNRQFGKTLDDLPQDSQLLYEESTHNHDHGHNHEHEVNQFSGLSELELDSNPASEQQLTDDWDQNPYIESTENTNVDPLDNSVAQNWRQDQNHEHGHDHGHAHEGNDHEHQALDEQLEPDAHQHDDHGHQHDHEAHEAHEAEPRDLFSQPKKQLDQHNHERHDHANHGHDEPAHSHDHAHQHEDISSLDSESDQHLGHDHGSEDHHFGHQHEHEPTDLLDGSEGFETEPESFEEDSLTDGDEFDFAQEQFETQDNQRYGEFEDNRANSNRASARTVVRRPATNIENQRDRLGEFEPYVDPVTRRTAMGAQFASRVQPNSSEQNTEPEPFAEDNRKYQFEDRTPHADHHDHAHDSGFESTPLTSQRYIVERNDTFWSISRKVYGTPRYFLALARHNEHQIPDPRRMQPGVELQIPTIQQLQRMYPGLALPRQSRIPGQYRGANSTHSLLPDGNRTAGGFSLDSGGKPIYQVSANDTLGSIAQIHLGGAGRWEEIYHLNQHQLGDPRRLKIGTVLRLPANASRPRLAERPSQYR